MATNSTERNVTGWVGWVYFAGFMMSLLGVFQAIIGLTALLNDKFYLALHGRLLVFNFTAWGWIHLIYGILMLVVGTSLFSGRKWALVVAAILATFNFILQFAFVSAYPIWSIIVMILDIVVIYALTVHGQEASVDV